MSHPKDGILHDYDLRANDEPTAQQQTCVTCGMSDDDSDLVTLIAKKMQLEDDDA